MDRDSSDTQPSLFFITGAGAVTPLLQPRTKQSIDFCMTAFSYAVSQKGSYWNPSATITPQPPKPPSSDVSKYWRYTTRAGAIANFNHNDRFIYICYNSGDADSNRLLPMIKSAVSRSGAVVYATDCVNVNEKTGWFGSTALNGKPVTLYPTIFFVHGNKSIPAASVQPNRISELLQAFANFLSY
jgi:hypothetical protein